jgi:hypothetical protein
MQLTNPQITNTEMNHLRWGLSRQYRVVKVSILGNDNKIMRRRVFPYLPVGPSIINIILMDVIRIVPKGKMTREVNID